MNHNLFLLRQISWKRKIHTPIRFACKRTVILLKHRKKVHYHLIRKGQEVHKNRISTGKEVHNNLTNTEKGNPQ